MKDENEQTYEDWVKLQVKGWAYKFLYECCTSVNHGICYINTNFSMTDKLVFF